MIIREMFADDINRPISGVIQVEQDQEDVIDQEVREYVVTRELKKHFISFFNNYGDAFEKPTADTGVWISGFFGSGKSHFLKMLSYILENKSINGVKTVERFRDKFQDDPATFMLIDYATRNETETILFNIDVEAFSDKDKTAVLRVFAKMFYNHLGYYGEDLKVAKLERFIAKKGKIEEFRRVFEEKNGEPWLEARESYTFFEDDVVDTLVQVLGMSETAAHNWFDGTETAEISIAQLVSEVKEYVDTKPKDFRLLFMIDEVGQYVGSDLDLLINLQSLTEKFGSECLGKVWVVCTGQEAVDEVIKVRQDEFSRVQARFTTRLSLTSSSVDEVVQKRILRKKPEATKRLESIYNENEAVLRNLFSFKDTLQDIKGFGGPAEFAMDFPFIPYQFTILQKVFNEIRKHGNAGKHQSNGERSMLSGFQECAQKVQEGDEYTLVPFYRFYDTVHTFLDSSIRRVIERCQRAANAGDGIEQQDVDVLKLLYMIRYIERDIKGTLDNIVILMADDIRVDKIVLREAIRASLDRLYSQNYIGKNEDVYNFLTDEEQDIEREIKETPVDSSAIVEKISSIIYADIYDKKKVSYGKYSFEFDKYVDGVSTGAITNGMKLRFLTDATDAIEKNEMRLMGESYGQVIVVLLSTNYYNTLESALKIRKYVKQRNTTALPTTVQDIIRREQDKATSYEANVRTELCKAIEGAKFYVDGERLEIKGGDAKSKIEQALEYLVSHVYSELDLIAENASSDADILEILTGGQQSIDGLAKNQSAASKIEEYLELQAQKRLPTSMNDVQNKFQSIPYGWLEIDIAAVVALLITQQKVTIKYAGTTVQPSNPKRPDMLRKKSEIGKTSISKRQAVSSANMKDTREFLRDYFDVMDVPNDEDGLVAFIVKNFEEKKTYFSELLAKYEGKKYPDREVVAKAVELTDNVLSQQKDNIALIQRVLKLQDDLLDNKDDLQNVESFFKNQVQIYDAACKMLDDLQNELSYLSQEEEAYKALNRIRLLIQVNAKFEYKSIPELTTLMAKVREGHDRLLKAKRDELLEYVRQCLAEIHTSAGSDYDCKSIVEKADNFFGQMKEDIGKRTSIALLDSLQPTMWSKKDEYCSSIEVIKKGHEAPAVTTPPANPGTYTPKKLIKSYKRELIFPTKRMESAEEIDAYIESLRTKLKDLLKNSDGIEIK